MKRIVIIGGAGFLGRSLSAKIADDYDVVTFDRVEPATIVGDALDPAQIAPVVQSADIVWIRAGILGGNASVDVANAERYLRTNVDLVRIVLNACDTQAIFYDSSEQVFAANFYGASKAIAEKILWRWTHAKDGRSVQIFRYPRVRSAETRDVITAMVNTARVGKTFRFTVNPERRISFVHIDDVIAANVAALRIRPRFAIHQVSCDRPYSLLELSQLVGVHATFDEEASLPFEPFVIDMPWQESARNLGVYPKWTVPAMIRETVSRASAPPTP
jgi:nucleoside-diphosphate-sugar epimerase